MRGVSFVRPLCVEHQARVMSSQSYIDNITTCNEYLDEEKEDEEIRTKYLKSSTLRAVFITSGLTLRLSESKNPSELNSPKNTTEEQQG